MLNTLSAPGFRPYLATDLVGAEAGGARVESVQVIGEQGVPTTAVLGGERVTLRVEVSAVRDVTSAIVGFNLKDRLGQVLFGDNTCLATAGAPVVLAPGQTTVAEFILDRKSTRLNSSH